MHRPLKYLGGVLFFGMATTACGALFGVDFADTSQSTKVTGDGSAPSDVVLPPAPPAPDGSCASDRKLCGELCVSKKDPAYACGCSAACTDGLVCSGGSCTDSCAPGETACTTACVNLQSDDSSCGSCGHECAAVTHGAGVCSVGQCSIRCDAGYVEEGGACVLAPFPERVSVAGTHACAVRTDGTLLCWGSNTYEESTPPAGTFVQVSAAYRENCAIRTDGTMACWGSAFKSPSGTFRQVSIGGEPSLACAVKTDGTLLCWDRDGMTSTPQSGTFRQVSVGTLLQCAIRTDGTLACWGGTCASKIPTGTFQHIGRGYGFFGSSSALLCQAAGVLTDGSIKSWSLYKSNVSNSFGEDAPATGTFVQAASYSCGLRSDGTIVRWGLGGTCPENPPGGAFRQLSVAGLVGCGIKSDGTVACWGKNDSGEATPAGTFW